MLSSFLDNIAAALIGGTMAGVVFKGRVHIGYLAAIVAASNAGGAGSVVGDTTTTMMWIDGVDPLDVLHAFVAAVVALLHLRAWWPPSSSTPTRRSCREVEAAAGVDWARVGIVAFILVAAIGANVVANLKFPAVLDVFPVIGVAVWIAHPRVGARAPAGLARCCPATSRARSSCCAW